MKQKNGFPIKFSKDKLEKIGFAINCFEMFYVTKDIPLRCAEWNLDMRNFIATCLMQDFDKPCRAWLIEEAYESIEAVLLHACGTQKEKKTVQTKPPSAHSS